MRRVLLLLLMAQGCASQASPMSLDHPAVTPKVAKKKAVPTVSAEQRASTLIDDRDCDRAVDALRNDIDRAWNLVRACIRQNKFRDLRSLFKAPWRSRLLDMNRHTAIQLAAQVMATRGGLFRGDLPIVQQNELPIFSLDEALRDPERFKGRYVLFTAVVVDQRSGNGQLTAELSFADRGANYRTITAAFPTIKGRLINQSEYVFLAKFARMTEPSATTFSGLNGALVRVVRHYKRGQILPEL